MLLRLFAAAVLSIMLTLPVKAGDFEDGHAAYMHGDVDTAMRLWTPLAEQGNADAQYMLGLIYFNGRLVPQDYGAAVKWLRLAADQGNEEASYLLGLIGTPTGSDSEMGSRK